MNSPRFMIACDRCDQWFHGECIGIDEKQGEFIDLHFCDRCSQETGKTTSWKPKCGNPACEKPGRVGTHQGYLSKYCSQNCGMQVARARLELADMKRKRHALTQHVQEDEPVYSASIPDLVIHRQLQSQLNTCSEQQDQQRLQQIKSIRQQALEHVEMIAFKHAFLTSLPEPDNGTCGFDGRLTMDDALWMEAYRAAQVPPTAEVCSLGSKQCPRHTQWARLTGQVLALERQEQLHVLQRLRREKQLIQSRKQHRHDPVHLAQAVGHGAKKVNT
ncbi:hypothetical protein DM01DRAFT_12006 [Hesseltinella vesiculosa]|uniref:PHD-type domain-containing protein n=1 Tax=Hesseltinella vesiculosa TaxID=101127 RepID=A0A1X2GR44_9FUNG|nr:hypothetical protein DM01DRAFT_12006 [Hesseltinella vesiculosa]